MTCKTVTVPGTPPPPSGGGEVVVEVSTIDELVGGLDVHYAVTNQTDLTRQVTVEQLNLSDAQTESNPVHRISPGAAKFGVLEYRWDTTTYTVAFDVEPCIGIADGVDYSGSEDCQTATVLAPSGDDGNGGDDGGDGGNGGDGGSGDSPVSMTQALLLGGVGVAYVLFRDDDD